MAQHIPGAKLIELSGEDHQPWLGDRDAVLNEVEQFLTGKHEVREPERVLATVLFADIVGSTERAAALGDRPSARRPILSTDATALVVRRGTPRVGRMVAQGQTWKNSQ